MSMAITSQRPRKAYTWQQFDEAVDAIAKEYRLYREGTAIGVYGVPRGGLCLAVALSHRLHLPLLMVPNERMLWVDDIVDSGATLLLARKLYGEFPACAWFYRRTALFNVEAAARCITDAEDYWIVFPWEKGDDDDLSGK